MKCPQCGAEVREGKFCNYCGASLPDDTKRVEVKIDKRIEDVAEVRRAEYEAKESELRQKKMKKELRKNTFPKICGILMGGGAALCAISNWVFHWTMGTAIGVIAFLIGAVCIAFASIFRD